MEIEWEHSFNEPLSWGNAAYDNFAKLQQELMTSKHNNIRVTITWDGRLGRTFLFLIMCLLDLASQHGKMLHITVPSKVYQYLNDMNFLEKPQFSITPGTEMRFRKLNDDEEVLLIAKEIVENIPVGLSPKLHEDMVSRIGEMFNNAREHANAKRVVGCRYTKPNKKYCFACYDTGRGIADNVRSFCGKDIPDMDALKWALKPYNSTVPNPVVPRGLGLELLKQFAEINTGEVRICTGHVLYTYNGKTKKARFFPLANSFMGTLFEMDINAYGGEYHYKGEK
uniref:ATPase-like protein n=1 Tax=uncultured bacterium contig00259 TaxID=1181615 RepID=A0A806KH67_9BACT|nr:ATPase-like protein [uncultured bacterium contig00259]